MSTSFVTDPRDRRLCGRARKEGTIAVSLGRGALEYTPMVEFNTRGARLILKGEAQQGGQLDFMLTTKSGRLDGNARIVWSKPLPDGMSMVGVEFLDFTIFPNSSMRSGSANQENLARVRAALGR